MADVITPIASAPGGGRVDVTYDDVTLLVSRVAWVPPSFGTWTFTVTKDNGNVVTRTLTSASAPGSVGVPKNRGLHWTDAGSIVRSNGSDFAVEAEWRAA